MKKYLDQFTALYISFMPYTGIVTCAFLLVIFFIWLFWQSDSKQEIKADEARSNSEVIHANTASVGAEVNRVAPQVEEAEKVSQKATKRAKEVRKRVNSNSNIDDAMKLCAEAYGEENCR